MLESILPFQGQLNLVAFVYVFIFVVVMLDLWAGIRKAKARGEYRSSYGLRKTVEKLRKYYNMMLAITATDIIQMVAIHNLHTQDSGVGLPVTPIFTIVGALFVSVIEIKSIYEKNEDKDKAKVQEAAKAISKMATNREQRELINIILGALARQVNPSESYTEEDDD